MTAPTSYDTLTASQPTLLTSTSPECRNRLWGMMTAPTTPRPRVTASDVQLAHVGNTAPLKTSNWLFASMAVWTYCVCVCVCVCACVCACVCVCVWGVGMKLARVSTLDLLLHKPWAVCFGIKCAASRDRLFTTMAYLMLEIKQSFFRAFSAVSSLWSYSQQIHSMVSLTIHPNMTHMTPMSRAKKASR